MQKPRKEIKTRWQTWEFAPSSQNLEFRRADAAMTKDLRAARYKSQQTAAPLIPPKPTLASLRVAAASCKACDLWERATQTVFSEGDAHAKSSSLASSPEIEKIS